VTDCGVAVVQDSHEHIQLHFFTTIMYVNFHKTFLCVFQEW